MAKKDKDEIDKLLEESNNEPLGKALRDWKKEIESVPFPGDDD
jgi:hypothetical protein